MGEFSSACFEGTRQKCIGEVDLKKIMFSVAKVIGYMTPYLLSLRCIVFVAM